MLFFAGHCGFQAAVVVFGLLAGHSFRACTGDRFALVSTHGIGHVAVRAVSNTFCIPGGIGIVPIRALYSSSIYNNFVTANLVGYAIGAFVDNICRIIGNGFTSRRIGNTIRIHYTLNGRTVTNLAGNGRIRLFDLSQRTAVCVLKFLENGVYSLAEGGSIAICSRHDIAGFRCRLGGHIGLIPVFYRIHHAALVICPLAHGAFCIHRRIVASIRKSLTDAVGSNGALADEIIIFRPGIAAIFIEGRGTGLSFTRCRIHLQIHGLCLAAVNGGVVICIHRAGKSLSIKGSVDCEIFIYSQITANRSVARSFQRSRFHSAGGLDGSGSYI